MKLSPNPSRQTFGLNPKCRTTRGQLLRGIEAGGFPGIFFVHDANLRSNLLEDWIRLVCERDLMQFSHLRPDGEFAKELMIQIAANSEPILPTFAKSMGVSSRKVEKHLRMLEQLFVVQPLTPNSLGSGKRRYLLCDPSLCAHLGGSFARQLETWLWLELSSQRAYRTDVGESLSVYRSARGGILDCVHESKQGHVAAIKLISSEDYDLRDFAILHAFAEKAKKAGKTVTGLYALAPVRKVSRENGIEI